MATASYPAARPCTGAPSPFSWRVDMNARPKVPKPTNRKYLGTHRLFVTDHFLRKGKSRGTTIVFDVVAEGVANYLQANRGRRLDLEAKVHRSGFGDCLKGSPATIRLTDGDAGPRKGTDELEFEVCGERGE